MGLPFSREAALAGVIQEDSLADKSRTGGRLHVATGLAEYLKTLPRLTLASENPRGWHTGTTVNYQMAIEGGNKEDYRFSLLEESEPEATFSEDSGAYEWVSSESDAGRLLGIRVLAKGPEELRLHFEFEMVASSTVALIAGDVRPSFFWAGQKYPWDFSGPGRAHSWHVTWVELDGRSRVVFAGNHLSLDRSPAPEIRLPKHRKGFLKIRVDGKALLPLLK
jgi:hypothetical protein